MTDSQSDSWPPCRIPHTSSRTIHLDVDERTLSERRALQEKRDKPYTPVARDRTVSAALRAYASMATSASDGAYRRVSLDD